MALFRKHKQKSQDRARSGSQNQRVISYYTASRQQLDSFERRSATSNDSLAYSKFERLRSNWFLIILSVVGAALILYLATLSTTPHVVVEGTMYRSASEYQQTVQKAFGNDIRNRIKPLLQQVSLQAAIAEAVPEASTVIVRSSLLGHRPDVLLVSDAPLATFNQTGGTTLLLSERGRLLLPLGESTTNNENLAILQNATGVSAKAGEQFMRPDEAKAFSRLMGQYKVDGTTTVATLTTIPHEVLVKESGRGYSVRYLLDESIVTQYGSLRAVENKLKNTNQQPAEYIDVRLADKVYYK